MTQKDTKTTASNTLVNRVFINAPIDVVWSTLTKTDEVLPFFFGAVCKTEDGIREGKNMRMESADGKLVFVFGKVLRFDPPLCYSHEFTMTNIDEPPSIVTYNLAENGDGTDFEIVVENSTPDSKLFKSMKGSQKFIITNLKAMSETGKPSFSGKMVVMTSPMVGLFSKKVQREENWPL